MGRLIGRCFVRFSCENVAYRIAFFSVSFAVFGLFSEFLALPSFAVDYSMTMTTSGEVDIISGSGTSNIESSELNVITNCKAGYNLGLSTSIDDNNLYLNGDSSNSSAGFYFAPVDGTTTLKDSSNSWGYSLVVPSASDSSVLVPPSSNDIFLPVPGLNSVPATLRSDTDTASTIEINDVFNVYYGVNVSSAMPSGTYHMGDASGNGYAQGVLLYYLTASSSCAYSLDLSFNQNLDGEGHEDSGGSSVQNFPGSSDNTIDDVNHTVVLSNKTPTRNNYHFRSWNTSPDGLGHSYTPGDTINVGPDAENGELNGIVTLYAIWDEPQTVNVNLDEHVSSVAFYNAETGTQQVTMSGESVELYPNLDYRITAAVDNGYAFKSWSTTLAGTLDSESSNPTTYTVTGSAGLSVFSEEKKYMQDFVYSDCTKLAVNENINLYDRRDEAKYTVARLEDGLCWMTSDLRLGSTSHTMTLTSADTDTVNDFILPVVETNSTKSVWGTNNSTENLDTPHVLLYSSSKKLYNWYTATAGTTYTSSAATTSICPAHWKLLTKSQAEGFLSTVGEAPNSTNISVITDPPLSLNGGYYNSTTQKAYANKLYWTANGFHSSSSGNYSGYYFGIATSSGTSYIRTTYGYQKMMGLGVRCILSRDTVRNHQVTVSLGDNVSSVTITDSNNNIQTVTSSNPTVSLIEDKVYTIVASYNDGYTLDSWSATAGGTIGSSTSLSTSFSVAGSTTLSVTSKPLPTISSFDSETCSLMATGDIIELIDIRDNEVYKISKLADGNCWMLDNLRLDLSNSAVKTNLTSSTTNASNDSLSYLKNGNGTAFDRYPTAAVAKSRSQSYSVPRIEVSYKDTVTTTTYGQGSNKIGMYYNYCAASAGSYCYGYGTDSVIVPSTDPNPSSLVDVPDDICPAGWRLPTGGNMGDYHTLYNAYSGDSVGFENALSVTPAGNIQKGSYDGRNSTVHLWSSTWHSDDSSYRLHIASNNVDVDYYNSRDQLTPIRCVFGSPLFSEVSVNLGASVTGVTFANPTYGDVTATTANPTVELRQGVEYKIKADTLVNHDIADWQLTGDAAIGSVEQNKFTIVVNGDSASITPITKSRASYTVTVNLGQHVRSVAFFNEKDTIKQIFNNNSNGDGTHTDTVTLYDNLEYIITSSFDAGYGISQWTTSANGAIGNPNLSATTYVINQSSTLSLFSEPNNTDAVLLKGVDLNTKIKTLAENEYARYTTDSNKIKALRMAESLPVGFVPSTANTVSTSNSNEPVYIFFDDANDAGIVYFYTEADTIYMNADSEYAFADIQSLIDISALASWDVSRVNSFSYAFKDDTSLTSANSLANWDVSSVVDMLGMFDGAISLTNIDGLSNWNVSNVTTMYSMFAAGWYSSTSLINVDALANWNLDSLVDASYMFDSATALSDIDGLKNWDVSSIRNMTHMFSESGINNVDALADWDTVSVTTMRGMFADAAELNDVSGLSNWEIGSVTTINEMFERTAITDVSDLAGWDTSNITDMGKVFYGAGALVSLDGLGSWDVAHVENLSNAFSHCDVLVDIDDLGNWNTSSVTSIVGMFSYDSSLSNIDALGNWNTGKFSSINSIFKNDTLLASVEALGNWDTSNVVDMREAFSNVGLITDFSALNDWDVMSVVATADNPNEYYNYFYEMFYKAGGSSTSEYHPEFAGRSGAWNSEGTFIPVDTTNLMADMTVVFDSHVQRVKITGDFGGPSSTSTVFVDTSGEVVAVKRGQSYQIEVTYKYGYEKGTIDPGLYGVMHHDGNSSVSSESVLDDFIMPVNVTTLTVSSQLTPNNVATTVNMDFGVKKVVFTSNKYDNASVVVTGSSIILKKGAAYKVFALTKDGYRVGTLTATGGTLSNNDGSYAIFTPDNNASITIGTEADGNSSSSSYSQDSIQTNNSTNSVSSIVPNDDSNVVPSATDDVASEIDSIQPSATGLADQSTSGNNELSDIYSLPQGVSSASVPEEEMNDADKNRLNNLSSSIVIGAAVSAITGLGLLINSSLKEDE